MKFKDLINSFMTYTPQEDYNFNLPEDVNTNVNPENSNKITNKKQEIFPSLNVNLEYMKIKYNTLINSDIVLREFTLNARGKQYNAFILYIDGMVNNQLMDQFILEPLMMRNKNNLYEGNQSKVISEAVTNNITVRKIKKFDLSNYLMGCLVPQNSVKEITNFEEACNGINSR